MYLEIFIAGAFCSVAAMFVYIATKYSKSEIQGKKPKRKSNLSDEEWAALMRVYTKANRIKGIGKHQKTRK